MWGTLGVFGSLCSRRNGKLDAETEDQVSEELGTWVWIYPVGACKLYLTRLFFVFPYACSK